MRPLLAFLLSLGIFGTVAFYLALSERLQREAAQARQAPQVAKAEGVFAIEITLTFDAAGANPFALEPTEATALRVRFRDQDVLRIEESVAAGTPVRIENIEGITAGANEFYIEAQPRADELALAHAVRVRVFRDGHPVADQTLWSEPGLPVRGTVRVNIQPTKEAAAS